jgi:hypothetical protein
MSLLIDARKKSSSSTIATNGALDNWPSGTRAKPPLQALQTVSRHAKSNVRKESRRGKPAAAKLWFIPVLANAGFISAIGGA